MAQSDYVDVLVVGAGISGICAGYYLKTQCPNKTWTILEGRDQLGGTWDLFKYPGIRSDSDMFTLGYSFRPWTDPDAIANGDKILNYLKETAEENEIDKKIQFGHLVKSASWDSKAATWTVEAYQKSTDSMVTYTCNFLFMCSGYYNYNEGYTPDFQGVEDYQGQIVHPQQWPEDLDYSGKRIVVIGSGATAVTLVPSLAEDAAHVTMLQRSPTYIVSRPTEDKWANRFRKLFPTKMAYNLTRWKNILYGIWIYRVSQRRPHLVKKFIKDQIRETLGPDFDVEKHFTPRYNPWDQRLCLVPDNDLFDAINNKKASIVTDHIERFTEKGLLLKSGEELEADIIVTATGLNLLFMGGLDLSVDGEPVHSSEVMNYKGVMFSNVPNLALAFGYTNASWTLKCELACGYVTRLLNLMDKRGAKQATPRPDESVTEEEFMSLSANYIQRSRDLLPKQGDRSPWKLHQNYILDNLLIRMGKMEDGALELK